MTAEAAAWVDAQLAKLAALRASDFVLEPQSDGSALAMVRIDGVRREIASHESGAAALARLKALAKLPAYITDEVQDGRIDGQDFGIAGDLRLAVLPTVDGGRAALRLPALGQLPAPHELGLPVTVVDQLRGLIARPDGLVLISGPTGSGKTTTIHSFMRALAAERADKVLLTIEDPVERRLPGIVQVEINHHRGFGFEQAVRAALRQDADVVVVGEIRDRETATAALRASLGGHMVLATVHAARAVEVVPRLRDMGISDELLLPGLSGVLAQRLVRRLHKGCSGMGCDQCSGGYYGRAVVCDWLPVAADQRRAWAAGQQPVLVADMDQQAAQLVAGYATNEAEVERVLGYQGGL